MQQSELSDAEPTNPQVTKMEMLPGFRFHPTEQELVGFYLKRMVEGKRIACDFIPKVDLYRYDPWELIGMARTMEKEWFFFVPRDSKYPNGGRPNRRTKCGFWKATGTDKTVELAPNHSIMSHNCYGLRKTLVYYKGRAPKGTKTEWIMNEYRLSYTHDSNGNHATKENLQSSLTLCRVYRKSVPIQKEESETSTAAAVEWPMMKPCKLEEFDYNHAINHFTKPPPSSQISSGGHGGAHAGGLQAAAGVDYHRRHGQEEAISGPKVQSDNEASLSTCRSLNESWAKYCAQLSPTSSCVTVANQEDYRRQQQCVINEPAGAGIHAHAGGCSENKLQSEFARAPDHQDHDMEIELWSDY